jgi:hypothetical protein
VDHAVLDLAVVDLAVVDLAKDPCARANLKTQTARTIQSFASENVRACSEPELLFLAYRKNYGGFNRQDLSQDPLR